jgi:hypothetical protein
MILRDEAGQIIRLTDGMGIQTHERLRGLADPIWLWVTLGLAALLSVTTLLGLIWRRELSGESRLGTVAACVSIVGSVSVIALIGAGAAAGLAASRLGSEFQFNQPQPTLEAFLVMGDVVAVVAAVALFALVLVWRVPRWDLWRRVHQSIFALSLLALSALLLFWGLAFGGPI